MSDATATRPKRVIVVAMARNRVIGRDNSMPWRMPSDLKHFKTVTMGRPMIMGRKTFLSIGKALPGRTSIVVTRDGSFSAEGVLVAPSIEAALDLAETVARRNGVDEIMITGGGEIYTQALPFADRVVASEIALNVDGHVRFPALDPAEWSETSRVAAEHDPRDESNYEIVTYDRLPATIR